MSLRKFSVVILLLACTGVSHAEVEPILTMGVESGGDKLVTTTTTDLRAGGGVTVGAGLSFSRPNSDLSLRLVLHYLYNTVDFTSPDGTAKAHSFPLELGLFNRWQRHEFGAGPSVHLDPYYSISSSSPLINGRVDFDTAVGVFLQYNYIFSQAQTSSFSTDTYLAVKLRAMNYEKSNSKINADSLGVYLGAKF
jgi:hypothetical protein